jgi:hypothetical protein
MRSGVSRFLKRQLSMAWERWQFWYEALMEQRRLLAHAVAKMQKRQLSMAWNTWCTRTGHPLSATAADPSLGESHACRIRVARDPSELTLTLTLIARDPSELTLTLTLIARDPSELTLTLTLIARDPPL